MPEQYVARDTETGFEVTVTGEFPAHPDDRMRIARTTTLFTRLMATLLQRDESQRRMGFRAIEVQLEIADALIKQDHQEVQRLLRDTLSTFGVKPEHLREFTERIAESSGMDPQMAEELARTLGFTDEPEPEADFETIDASVEPPPASPKLSELHELEEKLRILKEMDELLTKMEAANPEAAPDVEPELDAELGASPSDDLDDHLDDQHENEKGLFA